MLALIKKTLKEFKDAFLEEFSSVKLAIALFLFLAFVTLIGTVLPQEPMVGIQELIKQYGEKKFQLFRSIGLTDVFHSWWYLALLAMLGCNITVASFRKVFPKWHLAFAWPKPLNEEAIKKLPIFCEIPCKEGLSIEKIEELLKKKNYKVKINSENLFAVKGGWHRLGASITHIGIMILLIGGTISVVTGFNGQVQLAPSEGFYIADLSNTKTQFRTSEQDKWISPISRMPIWFGSTPKYFIKVNNTWRESYKTGEPKQWYSDLTLFDENNQEVKRQIISVNHPLQFMGLDIYQSNWGRFAEIGFNNEVATLPLENIMGEEIVFLPLSNDVGLKLKINTDGSSPIEHVSLKNIKDILEVYSVWVGNSQEPPMEKYLGSIEKGRKLQIGPLKISYFGSQTLTGLQFKSNPGDLLIYPAVFFIIIGVLIAFGSKRQIWAILDSENEHIVIGGTADRAKQRFFEEFENLISKLV